MRASRLVHVHVRVDDAGHQHEIAVVDNARINVVIRADAGDAIAFDVNRCGAAAEDVARAENHSADATTLEAPGYSDRNVGAADIRRAIAEEHFAVEAKSPGGSHTPHHAAVRGEEVLVALAEVAGVDENMGEARADIWFPVGGVDPVILANDIDRRRVSA